MASQVQEAQQRIYAAVDQRVTEWGIEHNERAGRLMPTCIVTR